MLVISIDQRQNDTTLKSEEQMIMQFKKPKNQKNWTICEIEILAGFHNAGISPEELTNIFGRTANALKHRASIHGIKLGAKNKRSIDNA